MALAPAEKIGKLTAYLDMIKWAVDYIERTEYEETRREQMDKIHDLLAEAKEVADIPTDWSR